MADEVTVFATLEDYVARYGWAPVPERGQALLADASAIMLAAYEAYWGEEYEEGAHPAFDRAAAAVCCKLTNQALSVPDGLLGATQYSQTAGDLSASVTYGNGALGDMWLSRADLRLLGLDGQRRRVLFPVGGEAR